ncbi:MAG TPA: DNA repair protein RadA [Phycisphaerales bacterium]|nr:DNA repair protein RadA [Phycisphaerales bacterium]HMP38683.1 DNA repair protein RadA [Phycisphaerales bacterium]
MAKARTSFVCRQCGGAQAKWMGKCPDCGAWDALEKFVETTDRSGLLIDAPSGGASAARGGAGADDLLGGVSEWIGGAMAAGGPASDATGGSAGGVGHGERSGSGSAGEVSVEADAAGAIGASTRSTFPGRSAARPTGLSEIPLDDVPRVSSGVAELDRVLGGGIVPGSVILLGGDPGIGKSTLLLQSLGLMASGGPQHPSAGTAPILYVSSEESPRQIRLRAERLGLDGSSLFVLGETNLARIVEQARRLRPLVCAIDSIQMVHRSDLPAAPGSITQLRRCCTDLVHLAKRSGMAIFVVGHVTKDGQLAGPKLLEHLVDVVLSFEGDRHHAYRLVRAVKNRFGDTQELGLFEMTGDGLREVAEGALPADPLVPPAPGTAICPTIVGSRCLLAEVQALTATGILGAARRKASGIDASRLAMLIAVLEKHGGLRLADQDIYAAAAGGLRVVEPAADLAVALAIAGTHYGRTLEPGTVVFGEVALTGAVRPVPGTAKRVREALRRGFRRVILARESETFEGFGNSTRPVASLADAIGMLEAAPRAPSARAAPERTGSSARPPRA